MGSSEETGGSDFDTGENPFPISLKAEGQRCQVGCVSRKSVRGWKAGDKADQPAYRAW